MQESVDGHIRESTVSEKVAIWKAQLEEGGKAFYRDDQNRNEFCHWANVDRIPPKGNRKRIVYTGESGARGFLLDPYYRPAACLEDILNSSLESEGVEIIDLARVSIRINELLNVCLSSKLLEPDAVVVYAGDNWRKALWAFQEDEVEEILNVMDGPERFRSIRKVFERKSGTMVRSFMKSLYETFVINGIPVIFVIPEFNLRGWQSNESDKILSWPMGETEKWKQIRLQTEQLLSSGRLEDLLPVASQLIELNESNPLGYEMMAAAYDRLGKHEEARAYFEAGRDTNIFRLGPPPACTSFIRRQILACSSEFHIQTADLPSLFKDELKGGIPGFDLFLDYCHLNPEGIQIAMRHVAQILLPIIQNYPTPVVNSAFEAPSAEIMARSHFYTAMHSAHIGDQPFKVLYQHCKTAIQLWPGIEEMFRAFVDLTSRKTPWVINSRYESVSTKQYVIFRKFRDCQIMDIELTNAIVRCLKEEGIDIEDEVRAVRISEHQPAPGRAVNLLESYYRENNYFNVFAGSKSVDYNDRKQVFYSARDGQSSFYMIADGKRTLKAKLTLRRPILFPGQDMMSIAVNNKLLRYVKLQEDWQDIFFDISPEYLSEDGVNMIQMNWPCIDAIMDRIRAEYSAEYSGFERIIKLARPVYGEIFRFDIEI